LRIFFHRKKAIMKLTLLALALASLAATAHADNISLRVSYGEGRQGTSFTPIHAEVGRFGVTPNVAGDAGARQWKVVAKDAQGKVLHEVMVRNGQQRHVEVFDRKTGAIALAQSVREPSGVFEVSLPFTQAVASVEVLDQDSGARTLGGAARLASYARADLERIVANSKRDKLAGIATLAAPTATTIFETGPAAARMDYVFVGDGYTAAEMGKWQADAKLVIDGFMADPLFAANRGAMNVRRVDVVSNQSGVDEIDRGIYRDTAMDGQFGCYNIDRLLCVNTTKVFNLVGAALAPDQRDVIVVISNSTRYGGSGGAVATLSMHAQSTEVALHEIGHTAFKLADEYDYGTCDLSREPSEGDVSLNYTRNVKWGSQIAAATPVPTPLNTYANGTVGTFRGGQYCTSGKYRPTENSRMRTLGYPWHAVNERLVRSVFGQYSTSTTDVVTATGSLSAGGSANVPAGGYVQAGSGAVSVQLTGPGGTDFDLSLFKYSGSAWVKVAESIGNTSVEAINYPGAAGYYYIQVKSYSGSGNFTVKYSFPRP
jgi:hypothetical protein